MLLSSAFNIIQAAGFHSPSCCHSRRCVIPYPMVQTTEIILVHHLCAAPVPFMFMILYCLIDGYLRKLTFLTLIAMWIIKYSYFTASARRKIPYACISLDILFFTNIFLRFDLNCFKTILNLPSRSNNFVWFRYEIWFH